MRLSPKESPTLPRLRLEEVTGHHQVLRRKDEIISEDEYVSHAADVVDEDKNAVTIKWFQFVR